jgi:hypothetical protein
VAAGARYTTPVDLPPAAAPLLAVPPSRFTAERKALADALAVKRDPAANAVRKLRRPVGLAWVLNRLAREHPRELEGLVAAGERLRAGQRRALSGRGADELRAAEDELRTRARALRPEAERILAAEGRPPAPLTLARLELMLRVTAPLPGPERDALLRGLLVREPGVASGELAGLAVLQGGRAQARPGSRGLGGATPRPPAGARESARLARQARIREERDRKERARHAARARREAALALAFAEREERSAAAAAEAAQEARRRAADARAKADRLAARARDLESRS